MRQGIPYPKEPDNFQQTAEKFCNELMNVGRNILIGLADHLLVESHTLTDLLIKDGNTNIAVRFFHYFSDQKLGILKHHDIGLITRINFNFFFSLFFPFF